MTTEQEQPEPLKERKLRLSKSWKTYLFEFVTLTFAVFMGFVAENLREEMAEKRQTVELAQNLYDELLADSIEVDRILTGRDRMIDALLELKDYVRDSSLTNVSKGFIKNYFSGIHYGSRFQPTDVVLEQLKNSGSLRYFKSKELQQLTRDLGGSISRVRERVHIELEYGYDFIIPFAVKHIDWEYVVGISNDKPIPLSELFTLIDNDTSLRFEINNVTEFKRKDVINMILVFRNLNKAGYSACRRYRELNHKLLAELRKEYKLKKS